MERKKEFDAFVGACLCFFRHFLALLFLIVRVVVVSAEADFSS